MNDRNPKVLGVARYVLGIGVTFYLAACGTPKEIRADVSAGSEGVARVTLTKIENDSDKWVASLSSQEELQWKNTKILIRELSVAEKRKDGIPTDPPSQYYSIDEIKGADRASVVLFSNQGGLLAPYYCLPRDEEKVRDFFRELVRSRR